MFSAKYATIAEMRQDVLRVVMQKDLVTTGPQEDLRNGPGTGYNRPVDCFVMANAEENTYRARPRHKDVLTIHKVNPDNTLEEVDLNTEIDEISNNFINRDRLWKSQRAAYTLRQQSAMELLEDITAASAITDTSVRNDV
jgi:hypothetical protein